MTCGSVLRVILVREAAPERGRRSGRGSTGDNMSRLSKHVVIFASPWKVCTPGAALHPELLLRFAASLWGELGSPNTPRISVTSRSAWQPSLFVLSAVCECMCVRAALTCSWQRVCQSPSFKRGCIKTEAWSVSGKLSAERGHRVPQQQRLRGLTTRTPHAGVGDRLWRRAVGYAVKIATKKLYYDQLLCLQKPSSKCTLFLLFFNLCPLMYVAVPQNLSVCIYSWTEHSGAHGRETGWTLHTK